MEKQTASLPRLNICLSLVYLAQVLRLKTKPSFQILHETSKLFYGSALFLRRSTAVLRNLKNEEKNERRGNDLREQGHVEFLLPKVKTER